MLSAAEYDTWEIAVIGRQGQPPLRFKGQLRARLVQKVSPQSTLCFELWARRKGDVVLAYSDVSTGSIDPHAMVFVEQSDAMDYLEMLCANVAPLTSPPVLPLALPKMLQAIGLQQQFSILVGDFLAMIETRDVRSAHNSSQERV